MAKETVLKSEWECKDHGVFTRAFASMQSTGSFCPKCSRSLGELRCKAALEQLFRLPFEEVRFPELRGEGGKPLQIDLYNESLKLAVEHHGSQHYTKKKFWGVHRYYRQREHDRRRRAYCHKNGITLIEIKQLGEATALAELKDIIKHHCIQGGVPLPSDYDDIKLDLAVPNLKPKQRQTWERLKKLVRAIGWRLKTPHYLGVLEKHQFICKNKHLVEKTPSALFGGEGCKDCDEDLKWRQVVLDDGRIFTSQSACARALGVTPDAVCLAAKRKNGTCQGRRVFPVSCDQAQSFRRDTLAFSEFLRKQTPRRVPRNYNSKTIILSDRRIFPSAEAAAKAIGRSAASVMRAAKREGRGTCAGLGVAFITPRQEALFTLHPELVNSFWQRKPSIVPYRKRTTRAIASSDVRLFASVEAAAHAICVYPEAILAALRKAGTSKGLRFVRLTLSQELAFKRNSELLESFCMKRWPDLFPIANLLGASQADASAGSRSHPQ